MANNNRSDDWLMWLMVAMYFALAMCMAVAMQYGFECKADFRDNFINAVTHTFGGECKAN